MEDIHNPDQDVESSDDGLIQPAAYQCSRVPLIARRWTRARSTHADTSATTWGRDRVPKWLYGSYTSLVVDLVNEATPDSEKKFRWVKCGLLMKPCTQSRAPRTSSSAIITRFRLKETFSLEVPGSRMIRDVSWNTCNKRQNLQITYCNNALHHWSQHIH